MSIKSLLSVTSILEWFRLFRSIKNIKEHISFVADAMKKEDSDQEVIKKKLDTVQMDLITLEKNLRDFDRFIK